MTTPSGETNEAAVYRVRATRTVIEEAFLHIRATSKKQAKTCALDWLNDGGAVEVYWEWAGESDDDYRVESAEVDNSETDVDVDATAGDEEETT